mmetsp:Transcript_11938/g.24005  ORF Transcript_11938/g.24005 Transcript_11938/m.24005 type:complete len:320 (-) Transcript_11938:362-1321(-)
MINGSVLLSGLALNLSWTLTPSKQIEFTLAWEGSSWAAIGLHPKPGLGMANAEIFMCHTTGTISPVCEVRSSAGGYVQPTVWPRQYITILSSETNSGRSKAVFLRNVTVLPEVSSMSVPITDTMLGIIFARGAWSKGGPVKHEGTAGRWQVNFFSAGPSPSPPAPGPPSPPAPPPSRRAGIWPLRFDAHLRMAPSQPAQRKLNITLGARLRYDFPGRRQRWEYWKLSDPSKRPLSAETWINHTLYELDLTTDPPGCVAHTFDLEVLRPDWLVHTKYVASHYLQRQPPEPDATAGGACFTPFSELADLFQDPAPIGDVAS